MSQEALIPKHGGFRQLKSFMLARLVYDVTVRFADQHVDRRSRTHDQMVQAARSGVQNIAEGSQASGTSRKMELKLTNVARASLEELRLDFEDFLRQRDLACWPRDALLRRELVARRPESADDLIVWVREVYATLRDGRDGRYGLDGQGLGVDRSMSSMKSISSEEPKQSLAAITANAALVLIGVTTALLDRQIAVQAAAFEREGGFTERLHRVRSARRSSDKKWFDR